MKKRQVPEKAHGSDVWWLVGRTNMKVHRVLSQLLSELDLTLAQHEILVAIWQSPDITQQQLAEKLLVVKSNISALVAKLERSGLLERTPDPSDNRNKQLTLSPEGEDLVIRSLEIQNQVIERMVSTVDNKDLMYIERIMKRVGLVLDEMLT